MIKDSFDSQSKRRKGVNQKDEGEVKAKYDMLSLTIGDFRYDENMWMIYTTTTNLKFFTALDTTHRARVKLADGSFTMA